MTKGIILDDNSKFHQCKINKKQQGLIDRLQRLADKWDKGLYLFVGDGSLHIIKKNQDGTIPVNLSGSVDQSRIVGSINASNFDIDGGGW